MARREREWNKKKCPVLQHAHACKCAYCFGIDLEKNTYVLLVVLMYHYIYTHSKILHFEGRATSQSWVCRNVIFCSVIWRVRGGEVGGLLVWVEACSQETPAVLLRVILFSTGKTLVIKGMSAHCTELNRRNEFGFVADARSYGRDRKEVSKEGRKERYGTSNIQRGHGHCEIAFHYG